MRPECVWSMSTVGLTAQEISFPIENPFLRGSYCHSMAGSKPSWSQRHELDNFYFSMSSANTDYSYRVQQKAPAPSYERHKHSPSSQRLLSKKSRPSLPPLFCSTDSSIPSPVDNDQVVPSFQKLSFQECSSPPQTPGRCSKPLPPIPLPTDVSPIDSEVEFFTSTDESRCLVSDQCSKSSSSFRYGVHNRRSFKNCGQINYAYYDGPIAPQSAQQHQQQQHQQQHPTPALQEVREPCEPQRKEPPEPVVCQRQQEKSRRLRRSHSGPAGSLNKPSLLRLTCTKRHTHNMDRQEVPPPIPPRLNPKTGDCRRWSAEVSSGAYSDDDKPPKVPPRDPMSRGSSRTPSPKSLPTYINGVMPPTQSFAPDPKYVSGRSLQRQNSEGSPCIHPIMEDGKKASATHYYLMPQRSPFESPCDCHTRRKAPVDLV
ncbi:unnamed protein product [Ophioblennius macclurei]